MEITRCPLWSHEELTALIDIWEDIKGEPKNKNISGERIIRLIHEELKMKGCIRSVGAVNDKIRRLTYSAKKIESFNSAESIKHGGKTWFEVDYATRRKHLGKNTRTKHIDMDFYTYQRVYKIIWPNGPPKPEVKQTTQVKTWWPAFIPKFDVNSNKPENRTEENGHLIPNNGVVEALNSVFEQIKDPESESTNNTNTNTQILRLEENKNEFQKVEDSEISELLKSLKDLKNKYLQDQSLILDSFIEKLGNKAKAQMQKNSSYQNNGVSNVVHENINQNRGRN